MSNYQKGVVLPVAFSSLVAETITFPMDTIRARIQNNLVSTNKTSLFNGLSLGLYRQISYTTIRYILYEPILECIFMISSPGKQEVICDSNKHYSINRFLAGGLSGGIGIGIMNPTEVIKTKRQTSSDNTKSIRIVMNDIYKQNGIRGFWYGIKPNVIRTFLVTGTELGTYDTLTRGGYNNNVLFSSICAGIISATISTPVDLLKTKMMYTASLPYTQQSTIIHGSNRNSIITNLIQIYNGVHPQKPSIRNLFLGYVPTVIRKVTWCVLFFGVYEHLKDDI